MSRSVHDPLMPRLSAGLSSASAFLPPPPLASAPCSTPPRPPHSCPLLPTAPHSAVPSLPPAPATPAPPLRRPDWIDNWAGLEAEAYAAKKEEVAEALVARLERVFPGLKEGTILRWAGGGVVCCAGDLVWSGVAWRGVAWRGVAWRGVVLCCCVGVGAAVEPRAAACHAAHLPPLTLSPAPPVPPLFCFRREVGTPRTHRKFLNRSDGSYGPIPSRRPLGMLSMPFNRTAVPGLYCVGDSTFPGQGVNAGALPGWRDAWLAGGRPGCCLDLMCMAGWGPCWALGGQPAQPGPP